MTIRERMLAVYRGQQPDQTPAGIYTRYLVRGEIEHQARAAGMGIIDYLPPVTLASPPWHVLDGFLSPTKSGTFSVRYQWDQGRRQEIRSVETPDGTLSALIEQDAGGVGSELIRKHYITNPEDYALAAKIVRKTVFQDNAALFHARKQHLGESGVLLGRLDRSPFQKCLLELCAQETFLLDVLDETDETLALLEVLETRLLEAAERAIASEADVLWLPDNLTADMVSPSLFAQWHLPYYQKLSAWARQADKPLLLHCDGKLRALVPNLQASGVSAIESMSLPEMAGDMTVQEARAAFPGMRILPNFPANRAFDSPESIDQWVAQQKASLDCAPWMLQISEDIPATESDKVILTVAHAMNR